MGRLLLDAFTEAILTLVAFIFLFLGWVIRWTLACVFFLAVMAAAGYYVFAHAIEGGGYVRVPDVTNRPITEASLGSFVDSQQLVAICNGERENGKEGADY